MHFFHKLIIALTLAHHIRIVQVPSDIAIRVIIVNHHRLRAILPKTRCFPIVLSFGAALIPHDLGFLYFKFVAKTI